MQTKPVQIYRITASDALPPAGALAYMATAASADRDTADAQTDVNVIASGGKDDGDDDGDLVMKPESVEALEAEAGKQQKEDDDEGVVVGASPGVTAPEQEGGASVREAGGLSRSSKESSGGGGADGREGNAPSFEKVRFFLSNY